MSGFSGGITPAFAAFAQHAVASEAAVDTTGVRSSARAVPPVRLRMRRDDAEPTFLAAARTAQAIALTGPSAPNPITLCAVIAPLPSPAEVVAPSERRGAAKLSPPCDLRVSAPSPTNGAARLSAPALIRDDLHRSMEEQLAAHGVEHKLYVTVEGVTHVLPVHVLDGGCLRDLIGPLNRIIFRGFDVDGNFDDEYFSLYWAFAAKVGGAPLADDTLLPPAGGEFSATLRVHLPPFQGSD